MLSEVTAKLLEAFFRDQEHFTELVNAAGQRELGGVLTELLNLYANDKNSSMLREWAVLRIAGCRQRAGKIGYNGYRGDVPYEVKPRNILSGEGKRLNGSGNFTDFTYERLAKYSQDGVRVLIAGFVDGELVYVLEVPFMCLYDTLKSQLDKHFQGERPKGLFLRSANFTFRDYQHCSEVRCLFLNPAWGRYANWLTRDFRRYLERLAGEQV